MSPDRANIQHLNKRLMRDSFNRAAAHYDDVAVLQRAVGDNIIERLDLIRINPQLILDVGAGTGYCSTTLNKRYKKSRVILLDIAPSMLSSAKQKQSWLDRYVHRNQSYLCADAETLPLADNSVDMLFSNLALQWCGDLLQTFTEFKRVLKPNGLLMFSTFGPDTLKELRASWQAVDAHTHVHQFVDMHDVGDVMLQAGLSDPVMDMENYTLTYADPYQLMRELKTLGAHNASDHRPHALTGRQRFNAMVKHYEQFRQDGVLPASYEVVFGHAWVPEHSKAQSCSSSINVDFPI